MHSTVNGWSSTLPTEIAALSSKVFAAPVSTWWSFIVFNSFSTINFELTSSTFPHTPPSLLRIAKHLLLVKGLGSNPSACQRLLPEFKLKMKMADEVGKEEEEEVVDFFRSFADVPLTPPEKRNMCTRCK